MAEKNEKKEDLQKRLEEAEKQNGELAKRLEEAEKQNAKIVKKPEKHIKIMDYLDEKEIPFERWPGILTFLKRKRNDTMDRAELEKKLKPYNNRKGGGV
ncbi:MAG: hypothetical protein GY754_11235 [bacterium]|nr:hypothetical protein [bacterium]